MSNQLCLEWFNSLNLSHLFRLLSRRTEKRFVPANFLNPSLNSSNTSWCSALEEESDEDANQISERLKCVCVAVYDICYLTYWTGWLGWHGVVCSGCAVCPGLGGALCQRECTAHTPGPPGSVVPSCRVPSGHPAELFPESPGTTPASSCCQPYVVWWNVSQI